MKRTGTYHPCTDLGLYHLRYYLHLDPGGGSRGGERAGAGTEDHAGGGGKARNTQIIE
jgi:hypothetical protein